MSDELLKRAERAASGWHASTPIADLIVDLAARVRELEADDAYVALKRNNDDLRERAERAEAENERLRALLRDIAADPRIANNTSWPAHIDAALAQDCVLPNDRPESTRVCYHNKPREICSFCADEPGPWTR